MSNYVPVTNFAAKDALITGTPAKAARGTEISAELTAIQTAVNSKEDPANKNISNGYAGLDGNGFLTLFQNGTANVGYMNRPIVITATNYTCVLTDTGKFVYYSGSPGGVITVPTNASVAYPIGTTLTVHNSTASALSLTCADNFFVAGTVTNGTHTIAQKGIAFCFKTNNSEWIVFGFGLS